MSNLKQYNYPGVGEWASANLNYAQAVRVENRIICSGQGGWDSKATEVDFDTMISKDINKEVDQAFENCDINLKHAGGLGWSQVYRIVTYCTDISAVDERIRYNLKKWMPNHQAVWTELGVKELGLKTMHIEIDVEAYDNRADKAY